MDIRWVSTDLCRGSSACSSWPDAIRWRSVEQYATMVVCTFQRFAPSHDAGTLEDLYVCACIVKQVFGSGDLRLVRGTHGMQVLIGSSRI